MAHIGQKLLFAFLTALHAPFQLQFMGLFFDLSRSHFWYCRCSDAPPDEQQNHCYS